MTAYEFAFNLYNNAIFAIETYTMDDAYADLDNAIACGWDVPEGMTVEDLFNAMNSLIAEQVEDCR